jgi:hypothetical protein
MEQAGVYHAGGGCVDPECFLCGIEWDPRPLVLVELYRSLLAPPKLIDAAIVTPQSTAHSKRYTSLDVAECWVGEDGIYDNGDIDSVVVILVARIIYTRKCLTSVDRDDLEDQGNAHFGRKFSLLKLRKLEVLVDAYFSTGLTLVRLHI